MHIQQDTSSFPFPSAHVLSILDTNRTDRLQSSPTDWLTAEEAAQYLKIKVRTLLAWTRTGKIKGYRLSGTERNTWRYLHCDLDAALLSKQVLFSEASSVLSERRLQ